MTEKNDILLEEIKKIQKELGVLKKEKKLLETHTSNKTKLSKTKKPPKIKKKQVTKKDLEEQMKELSKTLEKTTSEMEQHTKELEEELTQIPSEAYFKNNESSLNIIKTRLVNGEITIDEYHELKSIIE
ncbi:MAG: hypothetical protein CXT78_02085 [Thaumarchaeota archaeon]|jgi:chromosome segregation ATPase|nr:MAG: hypothetical protein CXT78_02085 [Nitrososphaerota archaeon]